MTPVASFVTKTAPIWATPVKCRETANQSAQTYEMVPGLVPAYLPAKLVVPHVAATEVLHSGEYHCNFNIKPIC
jgi:hypothetical protein